MRHTSMRCTHSMDTMLYLIGVCMWCHSNGERSALAKEKESSQRQPRDNLIFCQRQHSGGKSAPKNSRNLILLHISGKLYGCTQHSASSIRKNTILLIAAIRFPCAVVIWCLVWCVRIKGETHWDMFYTARIRLIIYTVNLTSGMWLRFILFMLKVRIKQIALNCFASNQQRHTKRCTTKFDEQTNNNCFRR